MSKIEIDDAMVERAARLLGHGSPHNREDVRRALDAALNPPAEPEIEVTEAMLAAGLRAIFLHQHDERVSNQRVAAIYRLMERERRKGEGVTFKAREVYDEGTRHRRHTDSLIKPNHYHRRTGDL